MAEERATGSERSEGSARPTTTSRPSARSTPRPTPPTPSPIPLARSREHKVVGGVCGGLGRYTHLDPVIFRVSLAVLSVIGGLGFVAYGVAWLVIPFEDEDENEGRRMLSGRVEGPGLTALLFVVAGCGLMVAAFDSGGATWFTTMVVAAVAGAAAWSRRRHLGQGGAGGAAGEDDGLPTDAAVDRVTAPPEAHAPPEPPGPSWWRRPAEGAAATAAERASEYLWGPAAARPAMARARAEAAARAGTVDGGTATAPATASAPWRPAPSRAAGGLAATAAGAPGVAPEGVPAEAAPARGVWFGGVVVLLALLAFACGTGGVWLWGGDELGEALVVGLAAAMVIFGLGLAVSSFVGRLGVGTLVAVVVTGALLTGAAALPENITTNWSERVWRPVAADELRPRYEVGSGDAELDLSALTLAPGEYAATRVEAGAGQLVVTVPRGARLVIHVEIGVGAFTYDEDGRSTGRGPVDSWGGAGWRWTERYGPPDGVTEGGTVELWLEMGLGYVAVEREV
ncbi:PspC domain-containing protein [Streptomyces sp. 4N509B]|uniref:PspC domain-containing protein n=1 Tax=Streptomyces sp. 4N509B TaxID=3457413 RepID=UPI003FCF4391